MRLNERVDEDAELAQLQARAYGPDADIDAAGAARLRELQERARAARAAAVLPTPAPAGVEPVTPAPPEAEPQPDGPARPEPAGNAGPATEDETPARAWWRRPAVIAAAGALAGVALAGGVGVAISGADAPDAVLHIVDEERPNDLFGSEDMTTYELYHRIDVRSSHPDGASCLFALLELDVGDPDFPASYGDTACAPDGENPIVELWFGESPMGWSAGEVEGFASGTFLRFQLDGDVVKVWRFEPPAPTETPAGS